MATLRCGSFSLTFLLLLLLTLFEGAYLASMTEKQMRATAKVFRNACQPKTKVTDEEINDMHAGVWNESPTAKCYMLCVLVNMKAFKKNGQPDWKSLYAQLETLPPERVAPCKKSVDHCKEAVEYGDDKCDNGWRFSRCLYEENPANYVMP